MRLETVKLQQERIDEQIIVMRDEVIMNPLRDKFEYYELYDSVRRLFLLCHHHQALQWIIDNLEKTGD